MSGRRGGTTDRPPADTIVELSDRRRIAGRADAGFGPVVDAFVANFTERGDIGAACSVIADGRPVVELHGGFADARTRRAWESDTPAVIFSCSKGLLTILVYRLVDDGRLELDAPVARYWPEFAAHGKATITVRDALTHRAGLDALDADLSVADIAAWTPVIRAIERQAPADPPEAGHRYHTMTMGWIVGEVIRRISGRTPGRFLAETIAGPLGLRAWIGAPPHAIAAVARMEPPLPDEDSEAARSAARIAAADPRIERAATMGGAFAFPADGSGVTFNDPVLQAAEIPAANGIATAASLARLYAGCVSAIDAPALLSPAAIADALRLRSAGGQLSGMPDDGTQWGTGFQLASPPSQPMLGSGSFGHAGAGGQLAFGDVDHRVGFAWLGNQMGGYGDGRARAVTAALARVLGA
ncbi:MAG TPA: serine hydrolase domain-containing protein [Candidatus Limnocylindrales bacterium]|nr:serine hydrolase domain-containing protein [Candidatus Limnocylindrales bacterium]